MSDEKVCVGAIAGAFGVHGEVRLKSFTAEPEAISTYGPLSSEDDRVFEVTDPRPIKAGFAARLTGVATREDAEALKGTRLYVDRERLPSLPDDEFYHSDLIGLEVMDTGGKRLGKIKSVHDHGAGDLLDVHGPGLKNGVLVPFTREIAPTVDLKAGRVILDPPAGLFPDD